jgi:hypothetical protein
MTNLPIDSKVIIVENDSPSKVGVLKRYELFGKWNDCLLPVVQVGDQELIGGLILPFNRDLWDQIKDKTPKEQWRLAVLYKKGLL